MRDGLADIGTQRVGRADAGRAAGATAARLKVLFGALDERLVRAEKALGKADTTRRHVEQVDRRPLRVRRADLDREAEVVWVAHEEQRRQSVEQIPQTGERDLDALLRPARDRAFGDRAPERRRLQLLLGKVD